MDTICYWGNSIDGGRVLGFKSPILKFFHRGPRPDVTEDQLHMKNEPIFLHTYILIQKIKQATPLESNLH